MPVRAVNEWLSEYKALPESELNTFANTVRGNEELVDAVYLMLEDDTSHEVLEPVCHQMFDFYRCGQSELKRFTKEAIPVMIGAYLTAHSRNNKKRCSSIEACLLGVYNLIESQEILTCHSAKYEDCLAIQEIIGPDGKPNTKTYTIPTLAVSSVYHEPPSLATLALTESSLLRYHSEEHVKITVGPLPQVERLHSQNRMLTLTQILNSYNVDIGNLSPRSHYALCKTASSLAKTGFNNLATDETESANLNDSTSSYSSRGSKRGVQFRVEPRIPLSSGFLVEMLNGLYFAMFNGQAVEGIQAINDIHDRAAYEQYADVLLVTNAIKNSLQFNPSGQPKDGPMGISIALSPIQQNTVFSKSAITNASFRTKKLPEDIDVPEDEGEATKKQAPASASSENPPNYEDAMANFTDIDKSSSVTIKPKFPKPLKGIMKKGSSAQEKQEKANKVKKEAEAKHEKKAGPSLGVSTNDSDSHSPKNPKHSISMSTGLGRSQNGVAGECIDPNMVEVQVIRSSSSGTGRSFQMVDYVELKQGAAANQGNKRSSTISEDSAGSMKQGHVHSGDLSSHDRDNKDVHDDEDVAEDTVDTVL